MTCNSIVLPSTQFVVVVLMLLLRLLFVPQTPATKNHMCVTYKPLQDTNAATGQTPISHFFP
jgi:hypothetical protein